MNPLPGSAAPLGTSSVEGRSSSSVRSTRQLGCSVRSTRLCLAMLATSLLSAAAPRPNLIFVMADDLGWGEIGAYPAGSAHGRLATPHLDRFASSAMRFTDAYAGYTVCAPSRTTLMTGFNSGSFPKQSLSGTAIAPSQDILLLPAMLKAAGCVQT